MDIEDKFQSISSKEEFIRFINSLRDDLERHPDEWENPTLDRYLEAIGAVADVIEGLIANRGETPPSSVDWKLIADILYSAKYYE